MKRKKRRRGKRKGGKGRVGETIVKRWREKQRGKRG